MITTQIFAHRGSSSTHPENTMSAFLEAEYVGADGIELDVQLSKDGEIVVIHDEKVNRTTNGKGFVRDLTLQQLKALNASYTFKMNGAQIPTLEEVFSMLLHSHMLVNIELKNSVFEYPGLEEKVIRLIHKYHFQNRVILSSFNHASLVRCFRLDPQIETAPLYRDGLYKPWVYAKAIGAMGIHPNIKVAPDKVIKNALQEGIAVRPYTINDEKKMKALFAINCSAIITDFPAKAIAIREEVRKNVTIIK
ncbi:MAG: glycerophosphodiester phosphodiesterase [Bacillus sp. (in: firmicutes)]